MQAHDYLFLGASPFMNVYTVHIATPKAREKTFEIFEDGNYESTPRIYIRSLNSMFQARKAIGLRSGVLDQI